MKKSIPLKEIVGFLPYGLQVHRVAEANNPHIVTLTTGVLMLWEDNYYDEFKPIVRPMSDINKQIAYNREIFIPAEKYDLIQDSEGNFFDRIYADQCESPFVDVSITYRNEWIFELHFDVYDWIKDGLAIDLNTL